MARTRNASAAFSQLDSSGNWISPSAGALKKAPSISGHVTIQGPGAEPVPVLPPIVAYRACPKSWSRNMDAYELAILLDMALRGRGDLGKGFVVEVNHEEYAALKGDVRRHFMAVRQN